jgi:hypothetical protein
MCFITSFVTVWHEMMFVLGTAIRGRWLQMV